jgi:alginate O-acetyltransferase complex protein AlgI
MLFSSLVFLYQFLPVALLLYFLIRGQFRLPLLLLLSLFFSFWAGPSYVAVLAASILVNYLFGLWTGRCEQPGRRKLFFILGIISNLALLVAFKYLAFLVANLNFLTGIFGAAPVVVHKIVLPLGISFYTFKGMSYLISVNRKEVPVQRNILRMGVYISFFPQMSAGPIMRYRDFEPQFDRQEYTLENFRAGIERFILGLGKKVLIASPLAALTTQVGEIPYAHLNAPLAWLGIIFYTLQLYYDFSGYTDMAIGIGRMFGFQTPENFDLPFISKSLREFWRRWHITLSNWFRDYLFLPIAFSYSRKLKKERYGGLRTDRIIYLIATSATFLLCGLWHGAAWTFIAWGSFHGLMLILENLGLGKILKKLPSFVQHFYLLFFLLISFVFFRADSFQDAFRYLGILFGAGHESFTFLQLADYANAGDILVMVLAVGGCLPLFRKIFEWLSRAGKPEMSHQGFLAVLLPNLSALILLLAVLFLSTVFLSGQAIQSFIYFKF